MAKVIILGGTGFLGRHVMRLAVEAGYDAVSLSRHEGCDLADLNGFVERLEAEKPDAVINCAAHVGGVHYVTRCAAEVVHDNMEIILNLYRGVREACPGATIVNPISNCSYPGNADIHSEPDWRQGPVHDSVLPYAMPRRMIYVVAECYRKQLGIKSVNWLTANGYGPGDYTDPDRVHALNGILIRMIRAQRASDKTFEIWGTGKPVREWCYIEDVARVLVDSIRMDEQTYPVNIGRNKGYSIAEITRIGAEVLGYDVEFRFNTDYADGAPVKVLDDRRFRERFPAFEFTPLDTGIRNTIRYYQKHL